MAFNDFIVVLIDFLVVNKEFKIKEEEMQAVLEAGDQHQELLNRLNLAAKEAARQWFWNILLIKETDSYG